MRLHGNSINSAMRKLSEAASAHGGTVEICGEDFVIEAPKGSTWNGFDGDNRICLPRVGHSDLEEWNTALTDVIENIDYGVDPPYEP